MIGTPRRNGIMEFVKPYFFLNKDHPFCAKVASTVVLNVLFLKLTLCLVVNVIEIVQMYGVHCESSVLFF